MACSSRGIQLQQEISGPFWQSSPKGKNSGCWCPPCCWMFPVSFVFRGYLLERSTLSDIHKRDWVSWMVEVSICNLLFFGRKPVVLHTSRFAYIKVVSPTRPWSIRIHQSWFAYIEKKCSHIHSNRIAVGQRNKLNLNLAICACCYYVSCVILVWHSKRVESV